MKAILFSILCLAFFSARAYGQQSPSENTKDLHSGNTMPTEFSWLFDTSKIAECKVRQNENPDENVKLALASQKTLSVVRFDAGFLGKLTTHLRIDLELADNAEVQLTITDPEGNALIEEPVQVKEGKLSRIFPLKQSAKLVVIQINDGENVINRKVASR